MKLLNEIQQKLVCGKNQTNTFGKYKYRSCEDILEGVKPLLGEGVLVIQDEIVMIGDRIYVKATVTLSDGKVDISATAFAREATTKKGMDEAQITGASSSYARKYALNGLFCIDDTKDADATQKPDVKQPKPKADMTDEDKRLMGELYTKLGVVAIETDKPGVDKRKMMFATAEALKSVKRKYPEDMDEVDALVKVLRDKDIYKEK